MPMLLYQSFPRRGAAKDVALDRGLFQLAFVAAYGLLLTPETLSIPRNPRAKADAGAYETAFTQCRACFTLISRDELWAPGSVVQGRTAGKSHTELFGPFAIGLDPVEARLFGLTPVSYYYSGTDDANRTHEQLFRLRELHELCTVLALLEARIKAPDAVGAETLRARGLFPHRCVATRVRIEQADGAHLQALFDLIDTDRPAAWRLADNLEMLLDTMQTADSATSVGSLAYYEQREWRITRGYSPHLSLRTLGPAREGDASTGDGAEDDRHDLRRALSWSDPKYFTDCRLDDCAVLVGPRGGRFFDFVREIVTPSGAAANRVNAWLCDNFPGVFEDRPCQNGQNRVFVRESV